MIDCEFLPVGILPTHRAVRLTLRLAAPKKPVRILKQPKTIPHPEHTRDAPQAAQQAPWVKPRVEAQGAQLPWDACTKAAEVWLLARAGVSQEVEVPYKGRGTAPVVRLRMPLPIATHRRHGEVHGKPKI